MTSISILLTSIKRPYVFFIFISVERSWNGTLLDKLQCLPCPKNTYSSNDGTRCLPCSTSGPNDYESCPISEPSHERSHEYCMPRNAPTGWLDVRNTYLVKFKGRTVDSYYFRTELRLTMYSCEASCLPLQFLRYKQSCAVHQKTLQLQSRKCPKNQVLKVFLKYFFQVNFVIRLIELQNLQIIKSNYKLVPNTN